MDRLDIDC